MKTRIAFVLVLSIGSGILAAQERSLFDGNFALVEIVQAEPFDASSDKSYVGTRLPRFHNLIGNVMDVYDGSETLLNTRFPMTPPPRFPGNPEELTHNELGFEGVTDASKVKIGSKAVLMLFYRKEVDPMKRNFNPYRFPDRSIFFVLLAKPGFTFDTVFLEPFLIQKEWAEWIQALNGLEDDKLRMAQLQAGIANTNPLISVSSVHLFKRLYPQAADKYMDETIMAPGTPVYARLAMDHEFCLSRGSAWQNGAQKDLLPLLEKEAHETPEGESLLSFRKQMTENGSWYGGRGERE